MHLPPVSLPGEFVAFSTMEPEHCSEVCSAGLQRVRPVRENGDSLYAWAPLLLSSAHPGRDWAAAGLVMAQGGGLFPNLKVPTWARHKIGNVGNWASRVPEASRSAALSGCLKCTYFEVTLTAMVEGASFIYFFNYFFYWWKKEFFPVFPSGCIDIC